MSTSSRNLIKVGRRRGFGRFSLGRLDWGRLSFGRLAPVVGVVLVGALAACSSNSSPVAASAPVSSVSPSVAPTVPSVTATPTPVPSKSPSHSAKPSPKPTKKPTKAPTVAASSAPKGTYVFPVVGKYGYGHTHHDYPATDIITNCGNEVRAATSGVILEVTRVDKYKASVNAGATRGGLSVSIKGDDGLRYYGSHMEEINANIQPGVRVTVGEMLGKVGRTGDASACHLHFGISPICSGTGDWWIQRGVIYPWPYLDSWKTGGQKSAVAAVAAWKSVHGCPTKPLTDP